MKNNVRLLGCLLAVVCTSGASAPRQPVVPLSLEDAFSSNEFLRASPSVFSPDGKQLAYVLCDGSRRAALIKDEPSPLAALAKGELGCSVWISPTDGGAARNVSGVVGNSWGPAWSPDGVKLAFYSDRGGTQRLWVWEAKSGTSRVVSEHKARTVASWQLPKWLPLRYVGESHTLLGPDNIFDYWNRVLPFLEAHLR